MKKHVIISIFLVFISAFLSCSNANVKDNKLLGTWELIRYEDNMVDSTMTAPVSAKPIFITFLESEFKGTTGRNDFSGDYTIQSKQLIFLSFAGTEIAESEWGLKFNNAIVTAYDSNNDQYKLFFSIEDDLLKMEYETSQFMIFKKS